MAHILLKDLPFYGYHGVYPEEGVVGTSFKVDLTIEIPDELPGFETDELEDTLNYEKIVEAVLRIGTTEKYKLIERLAQVLAESVLLIDKHILSVDVTVWKLVKGLTPEPQWFGVHKCVARAVCRDVPWNVSA